MNRQETKEEAIAVIVVDLQGDFTQFKDGSLAVPDTGTEYVKDVETATRRLRKEGFFIVATQDWHPADHISFYTAHRDKKPGDVALIDGRTRMLWPPHCIQGTENARVLIDNTLFHSIVKKAQDPRFDSYSAFQDEGGKETGLDVILHKNKVRKMVIFGLATDYCVRYAALDGLRRGYRVAVIEGLSRGITPEGTAHALVEMERAGALILTKFDIEKIRAI
jgi:nicotinamidase/pyrazinamidase